MSVTTLTFQLQNADTTKNLLINLICASNYTQSILNVISRDASGVQGSLLYYRHLLSDVCFAQ